LEKDEPEKTAAAYRGDFFVTGDQGRIDEDGYIWFSSRADDVIISAGQVFLGFLLSCPPVSYPSYLCRG